MKFAPITLVITALALLGSQACSKSRSEMDRASSPAEALKLLIRFDSGGTEWLPWQTTITGNGQAIQEYKDSANEKKVVKTFALPNNGLSQIRARIQSADFMRLRENYEGPFEDGSGFTISVTMGGVTHRVNFDNPNDLLDNEDVKKRIVPLLIEILRNVPSPNRDQTPGTYQRGG